MNLEPLFNEGPVVVSHVVFAVFAMIVGGLQFALPKGTTLHRLAGYFWVTAMALTAIGSFFIHSIRLIGPFSPIHILSIVVLVSLYFAISAARAGNIKRHRTIMVQLYVLALIVTGGFTLIPGRAMHAVFFGG